MKLRFACAASALTLGCALSAPAFAQGPDAAAIDAAAATIVVTNAAKPADDEAAGFDLAVGAAPAGTAIPVGLGTGETAVSSTVMVAAAAAAAQDGALVHALGLEVANGDRWPEWRPGVEFAAPRAKSRAARR